ncbi:MAG: hypothetical protein CMQ19_04975 [Gammaproteobacteria bacterium]|nr:hypothetical protein [Gammaproteobacteria bacterium]
MATKTTLIRWAMTTLLCLLIAYVGWLSSIAWPISPVSGSVLEDNTRAQSIDSDTITIGTYNIHSTKGTDGKRSIERIFDVLAKSNPDFVGLNEVRGGAFESTNQGQELAEMLGLSWIFAPVNKKLFSGYFGSAFLSRYQVKRYWVMPLVTTHVSAVGIQSSNNRNLTSIELEIQGRSVMILLTHLDRGELRLRQLERVLDEFNQYTHVILLGDLNSTADDLPLRKLLAAGDVVDMVDNGQPHAPHIDWILTRGFSVIDKGSTPLGASDHPYYWAHVRLKNG